MSRPRPRSKSRKKHKAKIVKTAAPIARAAEIPRKHTGRRLLGGIVLCIIALIAAGVIMSNNNSSTTPGASSQSPSPGMTASGQPEILTLDTFPQYITQGDPVMIRLDNASTTLADITSVGVGATPAAIAASPLSFSMYENIPTAFYGTGINQKTGSTTVTVVLKNTAKRKPITLTATFFIHPRQRYQEPLPVPDQIGGNSPANQVHIESVLDMENAEIAAVPVSTKGAFWDEPFDFPLATTGPGAGPIKVTDPYGFNRDTGETVIPHKGVDFKAASGTPVYAINDGVVRLTKTFIVYGNTVIVDHGGGIESLYMHLSRIVATPGEVVKKGELLGYSGETGYAVGPHLHLSIKIAEMSIDPMKFFALFGRYAATDISAGAAD